MDKRSLLRLAGAIASGALVTRAAWSGKGMAADPFALGVASGAPEHDGVVLWTRVAPAALPFPAATAQLRWELADDPGFRRIVQSGEVPALPELGHAVHVEARNLAPDRWYFYRFLLGDATSATGRTRTNPLPDRMPSRLRFAFASCQRWEHGFYAAWRHLAAEQPDLVVFLGDYIYEYATPRTPDVPLARTHTLRRAVTLADYRDRYALHKSDPDLQAAHRACPWIATWDDHEVQNDYAGTFGRSTTPSEFLAQRSAAYQAFYENMPLRTAALASGLAGLGQVGGVRVHSRYTFGQLARIHLLDTRQFRDVQACRDPAKSSSGVVHASECAALLDPGRTLLGRTQESWLDEGLRADASGATTRWSVLAQQTLFSPRHYGASGQGPVPTDTWDGYPAARERLLGSIQRHAPRNAVFVGGDIHQNYVCNVHADSSQSQGTIVASEFCGTSVTSLSGTTQARVESLMRRNPQVLFANCEQRGYALAEVTPTAWSTTLRVVDDATRPDATISTLARFVVEDRRPGVLPA